MNYSIYKANKPVETIEKIKNILSILGITLSEKILSCEKEEEENPHSLTLYLQNFPEFMANGKGTSLDNARASGYAEFIERLQNDFIFFIRVNDFVFAPDEKFIKKEEFLNIDSIDNEIFFALNDFVNSNRKNMYSNKNDSVLTVPFYNVKEKKLLISLYWFMNG